ncbi:hypothetical protein BH10PSE19_BH10PSE19_13060 [soil metagenome]
MLHADTPKSNSTPLVLPELKVPKVDLFTPEITEALLGALKHLRIDELGLVLANPVPAVTTLWKTASQGRRNLLSLILADEIAFTEWLKLHNVALVTNLTEAVDNEYAEFMDSYPLPKALIDYCDEVKGDIDDVKADITIEIIQAKRAYENAYVAAVSPAAGADRWENLLIVSQKYIAILNKLSCKYQAAVEDLSHDLLTIERNSLCADEITLEGEHKGEVIEATWTLASSRLEMDIKNYRDLQQRETDNHAAKLATLYAFLPTIQKTITSFASLTPRSASHSPVAVAKESASPARNLARFGATSSSSSKEPGSPHPTVLLGERHISPTLASA